MTAGNKSPLPPGEGRGEGSLLSASTLLTDNLPLLAGAPNGIKKLRELILELAVRGKLVEQDASDEPASELLKRIAAEKTRLVAEGKIKKQKALDDISEKERAFELPASWAWVRLGEICQTQTGTTPSKSQPELFGSDVPFIKPGDIYPEHVDYNGEGLSTLGASQSGRIAQAGSLLMVCIGTIGKCNVIEMDCSFNQQINSATLYQGLPQYLRIAARSAYFQAKAWNESSSTTIAILNKGKWEAIPLPLPSIAEQHRIVAKVDELMALCDRLEAQQADAASAHAQLVQALLGSLTQASDATEFAANWQRLAEHFHTLFTTEPSIDALKQTLLQLAVMGKLVPQDPNDKPASELLSHIQTEKQRLVAEGKIKKPKPAAEITDEELSFELPSGWRWARLETIAQVGTGATPLRSNPKYFSPGTINWITSGETSQDYISETEQKVSPLALTETNLTVYPPHTLVIAMYGQGKTRGQISELLISACTNQACAAIELFDQDHSHRRYVKYFFIKSYDDIRLLAAGGAQPNLNVGKIKDTVIPLPPLAEQHRIVAKLDQLMALCDQLKTQLSQARQLNEQLASTLVEQAVA
jgi:type I restriction enzyme S subunit